MGEEDARYERSRDAARRAARRVRTARTGPAARRDQGCQIRDCTIVDAGGFRKKSGDLVRERQAVKFAAIADWADLGTYPVVFMCAELEVSRSGYYAWRLGGRRRRRRPHAHGSDHRGPGHGDRVPAPESWGDLALRPWNAVHLWTVRPVLHEEQHSAFTRKDRNLLRHCRLRIFLRNLQEGTHPHPPMARPEKPVGSHRRMDHELLQYCQTPLNAWLFDTQ